MRFIKLGGLAAIAALVAMALIGAGSASAATALCKTNSTTCAAGDQYPGGTAFKAQNSAGTMAVLELAISPSQGFRCQSAEVAGQTTATTGTPLLGVISAFSLSECNNLAGGSCQFETINLGSGYQAAFSHTGSGNGTLSITKSALGNPGFKLVNCGVYTNCVYTAEQINLSVKGGAPAKLEAVNVSFKNINCFSGKLIFRAAYTVSSPSPLFVTGA